jgi:hypothetical protein
VPLSEDEERILQEIAQQFYESDPAFAREVGSTTLYTLALRNLKWATLGFVVGLVLLIATLSVSPIAAFGGFVFLLASALVFERNARRLGKAGLEQVTKSVRAAGLREKFGDTGRKMRERFRRDEQ